jgi:MFS family permease
LLYVLLNIKSGPSDQSIWVLLSYILSESVTFTVIGQLSDIFGRRWYYIGGTILALIGAIICSRATSVNMVIGGVSYFSLVRTLPLTN